MALISCLRCSPSSGRPWPGTSGCCCGGHPRSSPASGSIRIRIQGLGLSTTSSPCPQSHLGGAQTPRRQRRGRWPGLNHSAAVGRGQGLRMGRQRHPPRPCVLSRHAEVCGQGCPAIALPAPPNSRSASQRRELGAFASMLDAVAPWRPVDAIRSSLVCDDPPFMAVTLASGLVVPSLPAERVGARRPAVAANAPRCRPAGQ